MSNDKDKKMYNSRPNNKHAAKLNTYELKQEAYKQFCAHLAKGKSKKSWWFDHPDLTLTWETMEKYIANDPDFDPLKKEIAISMGFNLWEEIAEDSAKGINKDANTACLQMVMRNKFGWDKEDHSNKDTNEPLVKKLANAWRGKYDGKY